MSTPSEKLSPNFRPSSSTYIELMKISAIIFLYSGLSISPDTSLLSQYSKNFLGISGCSIFSVAIAERSFFLSSSRASSRSLVEAVMIPISMALIILSMLACTSRNCASRTGSMVLSCFWIREAHSATKSMTLSSWISWMARSMTSFSMTSFLKIR